MMSEKRRIAASLREIASLLELDGANPFKTRAFENAAKTVEGIQGSLHDEVASGEILEAPGIGKATGAIITELVRSGRSAYLEELRSKYPPGLLDLLRIPGLSAKKVSQLHEELAVIGLDTLEEACRAGRVAKIKGFGRKTSDRILSGIAFVRRNEARFLLPKGLEVVREVQILLGEHPLVRAFEVGGEVRRKLEVITGVEICLASEDRDSLIASVQRLESLSDPKVEDGVVRACWSNGVPITFRVELPEQFPLRLFLSTGAHEYVTWALERGTGPSGVGDVSTEENLFDALGIEWLEPELREPECESLWDQPPNTLVRPDDLRGIFHVHSTWSDGVDSLDDMLEGVQERGYGYVGVSDHSKSAGYAGGLSEERVRQQRAAVKKLRGDFPELTIFHGTEADILADGSIDYDPALLAELDFVIASIHSRFGMSSDEMTERLVKALSNPFVTFLGHMTGRMLLTREGYSFDHDAVFDAAVEHGVLIEINGNPNRRDIDWRLIRRARERGVQFSIHPDAHSVRALDNTLPGVWNARKAGLGPEQIFNTRPVEAVAEHLARRRAHAIASN